MITRSKEEKDVTFNEHEKGEHGEDWHGFEREKQKEIPTARYDKKTAEEIAKNLTDKIKSDAYEANKKFEKHQPDSRWKDIKDRELPH
jgi:hypothetical protein